MKERESNLELLRVICMIMLIGHHCVVHGTGIPATNPLAINKAVALAMIPMGKICFLAFLALSTWFMVTQSFKAVRFLKIWLQVFFYSVVFTIIFVVMSGEILGSSQLLSVFFPIIGNSHGFASAYLALYLLLPFLSKIIKNMTQNQAKWAIVLLIYFQLVSQYFGSLVGYAQYFPSEITLFVLCFLISFYLKRWSPKCLNNIYFTGGVFLLCWMGLVGLYVIQYKMPNITIVNYVLDINKNEFGIINIIAGYMFFFTFKNLKIRNSKFVNWVAKSMFGVLLIHDHNFFRPIVWANIVKVQNWANSTYFIVNFVCNMVFIFVVCVIIDKLRMCIFEKPLLNSTRVKKLCNKFDSWLGTS